jgi:hypothetical protein
VGMLEPVTMTRSATASPGGGGGGAWANAFDATIKGNPAPATRAVRTNPNLFSTFFIISFSIGLVRFSQGLSNL